MGSAADEPLASTTPRPSETASEEPEAPRPTTPKATPIPTAPAATGPRLTTDVVDLRMPKGWTVSADGDDYYHSATDLRSNSKLTLYTSSFAPGEPKPSLLSMVDAGLRYARKNVDSEARQAPNVRIDGAVAVHITGRYDDGGNWYDEYDSMKDGQLVTLIVEIEGSDKERDRVVNSILATWTWQDA